MLITALPASCAARAAEFIVLRISERDGSAFLARSAVRFSTPLALPKKPSSDSGPNPSAEKIGSSKSVLS